MRGLTVILSQSSKYHVAFTSKSSIPRSVMTYYIELKENRWCQFRYDPTSLTSALHDSYVHTDCNHFSSYLIWRILLKIRNILCCHMWKRAVYFKYSLKQNYIYMLIPIAYRLLSFHMASARKKPYSAVFRSV